MNMNTVFRLVNPVLDRNMFIFKVTVSIWVNPNLRTADGRGCSVG